MDFILKSQIIRGDLKPEGNAVITTYEFKTESDNLLRRRGRLFLVLSAEAEKGVDLKSAVSLFIETVQEDYFRLNDDTPMHAIEKALSKALNDLSGIKGQATGMKISFATTLVWNSVLYTSYVGTPAVYLIRGAGVRDLSLNDASTQLWTNSIILASNDVVVIGSSKFKQVFSANKIVNSLGSLASFVKTHPQNGSIAAIITKVSSKDKTRGSLLPQKLSRINFKGLASTALWKTKEKTFGSEALFDKFKFHQSKKVAPVSTIGSLSTHPSPKVAITAGTKPKRLTSVKASKPRNKKLIAGIVTLLGIGYLNYQMLIASQKQPKSDDINSQLAILNTPKVKGKNDVNELYPTFANTNYVGEMVYPLSISATKDKLIILSSNALYSIDIKTKEIKEVYDKFENAEHMVCDIKLCYLYANGVLHVLNPKVPAKVDTYPIELDGSVVDLYPSGNNVIYFLTDSSIYRLALPEKPVRWLANGVRMSSSSSFAVNGNVYVLSGRNIYRFSNGIQNENFSIDNSHLLNPKLIKSFGNKLYVLDLKNGDNKYLVVYDKNSGKFIKKIMLAEKTDTQIPSLFTVLEDNELIIFKKGDYLYKIEDADVFKK